MRYGIGGRTVAELDNEMSPVELLRWMAFFSLEPFGDDRADCHNAMILAQQYNMNRGKGKARKTPDKFVLKFTRSKEQSMDQMKASLAGIYYGIGGKDFVN